MFHSATNNNNGRYYNIDSTADRLVILEEKRC